MPTETLTDKATLGDSERNDDLVTNRARGHGSYILSKKTCHVMETQMGAELKSCE